MSLKYLICPSLPPQIHLGRPSGAIWHLLECLQQKQRQNEASFHQGPQELAADRKESPLSLTKRIGASHRRSGSPAQADLTVRLCRRRDDPSVSGDVLKHVPGLRALSPPTLNQGCEYEVYTASLTDGYTNTKLPWVMESLHPTRTPLV